MNLHDAAVAVAFAALLCAVAISDWRRYRVPDKLTGSALALRVVDLVAAPEGPQVETLLAACWRAAAMAGLFYLFRSAYRRWRRRDGMGLGDVKLAAVAGAWVDWPMLPAVIELAALLGLALAAFRARGRGETLHRATRLPFAVGFSAAIFVGWQAQRFYL